MATCALSQVAATVTKHLKAKHDIQINKYIYIYIYIYISKGGQKEKKEKEKKQVEGGIKQVIKSIKL